MSEIRKKMISGVLWQLSGRYSALIIQFLVTIVLARLLTPNDYGTIAILNVFITISILIVESGFGSALIQIGKPNDLDYSSVFYFNLFISILLYFVLYNLLPYISLFYNNDELNYYGKILFLIIPISSISIVQNTMLKISLNFQSLSFIQIVSAIISGFFGIYFAYNGYGIMSLIYHSLILYISKTILFVFINRWMPKHGFSFKTIKKFLPLSLSLLSTDLIKVIFNNIYTLVIGKAYTSNDVGYFNQASRLQELSGNTITDVVIGVTFPALVKIHEDRQKVKEVYSSIVQTVVFFLAPMMLLLILNAKEVIIIIFSIKWIPATPYLQILCIYALFLPLHLINSNILKVYGEGKKIVKLEVFRRIFLSISIIATIKISIQALLIGQVLAMLPMIIISMTVSGRLINYSVKNQLKDVCPYYAFSLIAYLVSLFVLNNIVTNSAILIIIIGFSIYVSLYIALNLLFPTKFISNNLKFIKLKYLKR